MRRAGWALAALSLALALAPPAGAPLPFEDEPAAVREGWNLAGIRGGPLVELFPALEPLWDQHRQAISSLIDVDAQLARIALAECVSEGAAAGAIAPGPAGSNETMLISEEARLSAARAAVRCAEDAAGARPAALAGPSDELLLLCNAVALLRNASADARCRAAARRLGLAPRPVPPQRGDGAAGQSPLRAYTAWHAAGLAHGPYAPAAPAPAAPAPAGPPRWLVCQPAFGLGNRVNALLTCFAVALATRRRLLLHWNCLSCHDQLAYPLAPEDVFGAPPIDWRLPNLLAGGRAARALAARARTVAEEDAEAGRSDGAFARALASVNLSAAWPEEVLPPSPPGGGGQRPPPLPPTPPPYCFTYPCPYCTLPPSLPSV